MTFYIWMAEKKTNAGIAGKEKEHIFAHELQNGGCSSVG